MAPSDLRVERRLFPEAAPALLRSYLDGEERLGPLYAGFPLRRPAAAPSGPTSPGPIASETAERILGFARETDGEKDSNLRAALADPRTVFVVAGQQPGVLLGPCLVFYKMASLRALARARAAETGRPVVPLFWIASHDADRDEIDRIVLAREHGEPGTIRSPLAAAPPRTQVGALAAEPNGWREFLGAVGAALPPGAEAEALLEELGALVGERTHLPFLFARTARRIGRTENIVFFDGRDAEIDPRGRSVLAAAVRSAPRAIEALRAGTDLLERAGFAPPIPFDEKRLPLFRVDGDARVPLFLEGDRVRAEGEETVPANELADRIESGATRATPAAALRPVVQDAVFPSAGMIAGHSELLYHAELGPLYECLGVGRAPLVPRASVFVLSRRSDELLQQMNLQPEDLLPGRTPKTTGGEIEEQVRDFAERVRAETGSLLEAFDRAAPGALGPEDAARTRLPREAERMGEKLLRLADKSGENRRNRIHRIRNELFPGGKPQETVLSLLHLLARYGPGILEAVEEEAASLEGTPRLLVVERSK